MNDSHISGKWKEIKGDVMKTWGELTDDEVERTKGNSTSLLGLIQQKFGTAKDEVSEKLNEIYARFHDDADQKKESASDKVNAKIDEAKDAVRH